MKLSTDSLDNHLAGKLARAYLLSGDEPLLVGEAADAIRAAAKRAGFDERAVHFIERVGDWGDVTAGANNLSLFGGRRLVEIRLLSGKPGVAGSAAIVDLLERQSPDDFILMLTGRLERDAQSAAWVKAFESGGAWLPIWPVDTARLPAWIAKRANALGLKLADAAAAFVADRCEGNLLAAQQELQKLRLLVGDRVADLDAVRAAVADSARYDVFQLGEAALAGDVTRAMRILAGLKAEGVEPTLVLWSLARECKELWSAAQGIASPSWRRPSPALERGKRRAARVPYARLAERASRADRMIKGLMRGDAWDELELLILEMGGIRALPLVSARRVG